MAMERYIAAGMLSALDVDEMPRTGLMLQVSAVHPASAPPGPAGRWLVERLKGWSAGKLPGREHRHEARRRVAAA